MDERLEKMLWLIESLPVEQIVIIAEKCKWWWEISPKVTKLVDIFNKLTEEEKSQFFRCVKPIEDASWLHDDMEWSEISEGELTE